MTRFQTIIHLLKVNGFYWLLLYTAERLFGKIFLRKRFSHEIKKQLPGFNTIQYNYKEWNNYNWSEKGEEWNDSEAWKNSLINEILLRYIQPQKTVLEIGPGAGRWSIALAGISQKLILVDLTEAAIDHCKQRLNQFTNCEYHINNGTDLSFLQNNSIHYIWSFGVFVHISPTDTEKYLKELNYVLIKGGIGIIHHPAAGGFKGGFRSSTTNDLFLTFLKKYNFEVIQQINSWGKDNLFSVHAFSDMITVFKKI